MVIPRREAGTEPGLQAVWRMFREIFHAVPWADIGSELEHKGNNINNE